MAARRVSDTARERVAILRKGFPFVGGGTKTEREMNPPAGQKFFHGEGIPGISDGPKRTRTKGDVKMGGRGPIQRIPDAPPAKRKAKRDINRTA
jgi:hypothetical protein